MLLSQDERRLIWKQMDATKEPKVYQSDETLTKNCDLINKLTDVVITYDFDDCTETVDRDMIKNWLTTDENSLYTLDKNR